MSHGNQSCHTHSGVVLRIAVNRWVMYTLSTAQFKFQIGGVASMVNESPMHINESRHVWMRARVTSRTVMSHATHIHESCHTHSCVMPHTFMSHVAHIHESHYVSLRIDELCHAVCTAQVSNWWWQLLWTDETLRWVSAVSSSLVSADTQTYY